MALSKDSPAPYAPSSAILSMLERSRSKGLPSPVDKGVLARAGISESLIPRTLQALQALDLVGLDGSHTETLKALRVAPEAEYHDVMANWLRDVYADVVQYADPSEGDETAVRDAFRPYKPDSMQKRMQSLFIGLFSAAGVWPEGAKPPSVSRPPRKRLPQHRKTATIDNGGNRGPSPAPLTPQQPYQSAAPSSEKALEYRLVDLLSEAVNDNEVMEAIIKVITFLKTKDAARSRLLLQGHKEESVEPM